VIALLLLLIALLALNAWLVEPLLALSSDLLELQPLPWLVLIAGAWLLAGRPAD